MNGMLGLLRALASFAALSAAAATLSATAAAAPAPSPYGSRYDDPSGWQSWTGQFTYINKWTARNSIRAMGDVNGDGKADIVGFGPFGVFVALSNGTGFGTAMEWSQAPQFISPDAKGAVANNPRYVVDVDGDGAADIVSFWSGGVYVGTSKGPKDGGFIVTQWSEDFGSNSESMKWPAETRRMLADVNGDKLPDLVGFAKNGGVWVALNMLPNQDGFGPMTEWLKPQGGATFKTLRLMGPVDGDRKADIVGFGKGGAYLSLAADNGFTAPALIVAQFGSDQGWSEDNSVRLLADVNGDGRMDIVGFKGSNVYIALAPGGSGGSWDLQEKDKVFASGWNLAQSSVFGIDMNADHRADIVGFGAKGLEVALSNSYGDWFSFLPAQPWIANPTTDKAGKRAEYPRYLADVNGDGRPDLVYFGDQSVEVDPSSALYCCDKISFPDPGKQNGMIVGALYARAYLPNLPPGSVTVPSPAASNNTCTASSATPNRVLPIVANTQGQQTWRSYYGSVRLLMNANFYDVSDSLNPYKVPCTQAFGWTISNGAQVTPYSQSHGLPTQSLVFYTNPGKGPYAAIADESAVAFPIPNVSNAVSGFQFRKAGAYTPLSAAVKGNRNVARSAVGLTADGKNLVMLVVNSGRSLQGVTGSGLNLGMEMLGASDALNLDGGCSAQMMFANGSPSPMMTGGCDFANGKDGQYRPVPIFLGIE